MAQLVERNGLSLQRQGGLANRRLADNFRRAPGNDVDGAETIEDGIRVGKVQGSELSIYYVLSTWNPHVVVRMRSRLHID